MKNIILPYVPKEFLPKKNSINLNVGCGKTKIDGFINVDVEQKYNPDILIDLDKRWQGIKDNSVNFIYAKAILEHVEEDNFFNESNRVLKEKGRLVLVVPHWTYPDAYMPKHNRQYSATYFLKGFNYHSGSNYNFRLRHVELLYSKNDFLQKIIGFIPNKNISLWEKTAQRAAGILAVLEKNKFFWL